MMLRSKNVDITGGPVFKSIIKYAIPIMIGTFIQVLFNTIDGAVVGNMAAPETNASASIGATGTIISLLVNSFVGLSIGVTSVLARCLGQRNEERAKKIVNTAMIFALGLGVLLMVAFWVLSRPLLVIMKCTETALPGAVNYLTFYALGLPAAMLYNFGAGIIRTQGDTEKPFWYITVAGVTHICLSITLCLILPDKVIAVAIANATSQWVSAILTLLHLFRLQGPCGFRISEISFSGRELLEIVKVGLPCALNQALFSISNLQVQSEINSFGNPAMSGNQAAVYFEQLSNAIVSGFVGAAVPFVGQNLGAGNAKRVNQSIVSCIASAVVISAVVSIPIYIFKEPMLSLFIPGQTEAIEFGAVRMKYVLLPYVIGAAINVLVAIMQAYGYSIVPMINSVVTVLLFRIVWMNFIYPPLDAANRCIDNVYVCYFYSWVLSLIAHATTFAIIYILYKRGKLAKNKKS